MCTLTYLPSGKDGFIFTSNRDEAPHRAATRFVRQRLNGREVLFPQDNGAGGTWLAMSDGGLVTCLINGAFERHKRIPPYRRSRGLMVLDLYKMGQVDTFIEEYPFGGMEPFTLVLLESGTLREVRWDGQKLHQRMLDTHRFHIWSSPVLYNKDYQKKRERWFAAWLEQRRDWSQEAILNFHLKGGEGNSQNDLVMDRMGIVKTVSISSIYQKGDQISCLHLDLLREKAQEKHSIEIRKNSADQRLPTSTNQKMWLPASR